MLTTIVRGPALTALCLLSGCVLSQPLPRPVPHLELAPAADAWRRIGTSLRQRPILARSFGRGPRQVLWIGCIHGNENEGWVATERLGQAFLARGDLAERVTLHMIRDVNPDGSATGTRGNANGVDLNRNFPARNFKPSADRGQAPLDQPESMLLHRQIETLRPDLIIVAHSSRGRKFINYDGPAERLARTFSERSGYPLVVSEAIHGTPGSLGSWAGIDLGIPILTLEYRGGQDPYLAWQETCEAILAVIDGA